VASLGLKSQNDRITKPNGKLQKIADRKKNVRDAFRNTVDRAIKQNEKYDNPLAQHMKDLIKRGNEAVYPPAIAVTWVVQPIANDLLVKSNPSQRKKCLKQISNKLKTRPSLKSFLYRASSAMGQRSTKF